MSQAKPQWKKGDFAVRKGKLCQVTHIDFTLDPPAVTVKMLEEGHEVGTEFSKLKSVEAPKWSCPVCTYDNSLSDKKCTVCEQGTLTQDVYIESLRNIEQKLLSKEINQKNGVEPIEWTCNMCTFNNSMAFDSCQVCFTVRSTNAKLIYPPLPKYAKPQTFDNDDINNYNNNNNNNLNDLNQNQNNNEMKSDDNNIDNNNNNESDKKKD